CNVSCLFHNLLLCYAHVKRIDFGWTDRRRWSQNIRLQVPLNILRRLAEPDPDSFYGMLGKRNGYLVHSSAERRTTAQGERFPQYQTATKV
uniref:Uncharacterized protein n=1 Tax=Xiphophorus couchianus TaxID=32473 RepID=A0A3B5LJV0_9TELE